MTKSPSSRVQEIIATINLADAAFVSSYGRPQEATAAINRLSDLIEASPIKRLAETLEETVQRLIEADPHQATKKPSFLARLTGSAVTSRVAYDVARTEVDHLLSEADAAAEGVLELMTRIDSMLASHQDHLQDLRDHIQAGQMYLADNPDAGAGGPGIESFEVAPRERFSRRLTNLATLLGSQEMSTTQLRLAKAQAADLYDRYQDLSQVLIPVWRHHSLSIANRDNLSPEAVRAANAAHEQLMTSLTQSLAATKQATRH